MRASDHGAEREHGEVNDMDSLVAPAWMSQQAGIMLQLTQLLQAFFRLQLPQGSEFE